MNINDLKSIIIPAAKEEILTRFTHIEHAHKTDGSIITQADLKMQQRLADELHSRYSSILFLGEEMSTQEQNELLDSGESLWCLDPVDGTRNFSTGVPYFCVSLALIEKGQVTTGIIYDPVRDECFSAQKGKGAYLNEELLISKENNIPLNQTTALVDFKRLPVALSTKIVQNTPYSSQRSFGSVALDWCWLAAGRVHLYLHGRQNIWDYAAGHLIHLEAGGFAQTLDKESVFINQLKARSAIGASSERLFNEWSNFLLK